MTRLRLTAPDVVARRPAELVLQRLEQGTGRGTEPGGRHQRRHRGRGDPPGPQAGAHLGLGRRCHQPSLGTPDRPRRGPLLPCCAGILPRDRPCPGRDRGLASGHGRQSRRRTPRSGRDLHGPRGDILASCLHACDIYARCAALGRRVHLLPTPVAPPAGPPLEKLAEDLRRLRPEARHPQPGVRMARQRASWRPTTGRSWRLPVRSRCPPRSGAARTGIDREAERMRLEHALSRRPELAGPANP